MQDGPGVAHQASTMRRMGMLDCNPLTQSAFQQFCGGRVGPLSDKPVPGLPRPLTIRLRDKEGQKTVRKIAVRQRHDPPGRGEAAGLEARTFRVTPSSAFSSQNAPPYPGRSAICAGIPSTRPVQTLGRRRGV